MKRLRKSFTGILNRIAKEVAPGYIAGPEINDAVRICAQIDRYGWKSAICPWDSPEQSVESVANSYKDALNELKEQTFDCYLSIKVPSLKYDFEIVREILEIAAEHNTRIHFDSHGPETASPALALLERVLKYHKNISYTLPSRWRRSIKDAERIIDLGVPVRVVKGQWEDPDDPKFDPKASYLNLIEFLSGRAVMVGVATHDPFIAKKSLIELKKTSTPCELEQLFGLPLCVETVAKPLDTKVRLYIPYGHAYLPYALSEAKKHPVIFAWLIRDFLFSKKKDYLKG